MVANGTLASSRVSAGATTWVYEQPAPMPTYLATVQIGLYDQLDLAAGPVPQRAAVPARLRPAFAHDFARQPDMMAVFTSLFGPYPFTEYGVVVVDEELEVPVEAHGLSIFGANHVDGRRGFERLVAHELAHQWFGNSLTVAGWRHIWLNEGFANYAEWLWSEFSGGEPASVHAARWRAKLALLPQDLRVADPGVRRMFDDRVYRRGALTLHALRTTPRRRRVLRPAPGVDRDPSATAPSRPRSSPRSPSATRASRSTACSPPGSTNPASRNPLTPPYRRGRSDARTAARDKTDLRD